MPVTQSDLSAQMLAQLRLLDPSVSAEVGTPERKIIDTVAQALSDVQVDLTSLSGALDVDAKVGAGLDKFLALFGFGRQQATKASGYITFSRESASTLDVRIPGGTQVMRPGVNSELSNGSPIYETLFEVVLKANTLEVSAPVRATTAGTTSNVAANTVTDFGATAIFGITGITNPAPITGGTSIEGDDEYKTRFKNTVFRNLAGTQDQFLALAASGAYTSKVNVVGPISRYREYIQVPVHPDNSGGNGSSSAEYTTAMSTIPYSEYIHTSVPSFVSNGRLAGQTIFWREDLDWKLNTTGADKNHGDGYRQASTLNPFSDSNKFKPSVTFLNVYTGDDERVTAVRPGSTVLFEHSYTSSASRNDFDRNVSNCVDVFIDGSNDTVASTVIPAPGYSSVHSFSDVSSSKFYRANFRVAGNPDQLPELGWIFMPMFFQPVTAVPDEITIKTTDDTSTFRLGTHYVLVEDVTELYGTVRARNGIAWNPTASGVDGTPALRSSAYPEGTPIEITGYSYDKNIVDLQANLEAAKQVTTDVLVHKTKLRYFKFDITVMYGQGNNPQIVNDDIQSTLDRYLKAQYFGNIVQLSDILSIIHGVAGVDNVRWSSDVPSSDDRERVHETNQYGIDRPGDEFIFDTDFFLKDNELPRLAEASSTADFDLATAERIVALPGLLIRARAQNTWITT